VLALQSLTLAKFGHEAADLNKGQRCIMPRPFIELGELLSKLPRHRRRIAITQICDVRGMIKYSLNAAPQSPSRLVLFKPYRVEDFDNVARCDFRCG
jgi:hypothetical protein